jgi:outer membrane cobalamin receptor
MRASIVFMAAALSTASLATLAAEGDSANELGEIVVTAEKTSEPLSKTPISISVVSSATLEEEHITSRSAASPRRRAPRPPASISTTCRSTS